MRWHLIHSTAPYLSDAFENENFHFYSEVLRGVKQMQPRWKRAIGTIDRQMGEALGQLYVEKYFTPDAKKRMDELVKNLMLAYRERIGNARLDERGDQEAGAGEAGHRPAEDRLSRQVARLLDAAKSARDSYVQNVLRAEAFETRPAMSQLAQAGRSRRMAHDAADGQRLLQRRE